MCQLMHTYSERKSQREWVSEWGCERKSVRLFSASYPRFNSPPQLMCTRIQIHQPNTLHIRAVDRIIEGFNFFSLQFSRSYFFLFSSFLFLRSVSRENFSDAFFFLLLLTSLPNNAKYHHLILYHTYARGGQWYTNDHLTFAITSSPHDAIPNCHFPLFRTYISVWEQKRWREKNVYAPQKSNVKFFSYLIRSRFYLSISPLVVLYLSFSVALIHRRTIHSA